MMSGFDHPLLDWIEQRQAECQRLRGELHSEHAASSDNRPLARLEVPVIEPLPNVAREAIEAATIQPFDEAAPALDHDGRRR